jgi:uroporphyrinogen-III synthase
MIDEGYTKLEIYQTARSLAAQINTLTFFEAQNLQPELGASIRRTSKAVAEEIVNAYLRRGQKEEFLRCLERASTACQETASRLSGKDGPSVISSREHLAYVVSSYRHLSGLIRKAAELDIEAPDSPFRVKEEVEPYAPSLAHAAASPRPLEGKVLLLTRTPDQSRPLVELLEDQGAYSLILPMIAILEPDSWIECDRSILRLSGYYGVIFTSANAVEHFLDRIQKIRPQARAALAARKIYAVGEQTRTVLHKARLPVALVPERQTSDGMVAALGETDVSGKRFLFPRSNIGRDVVPNALRSKGAIVDEVVVYKTEATQPKNLDVVRQALVNQEIDVVTFFSPSSVQNFVQMVGNECAENTLVAAIGPTTTKAAQECGLPVQITARRSTAESLVDSLADYFTAL